MPAHETEAEKHVKHGKDLARCTGAYALGVKEERARIATRLRWHHQDSLAAAVESGEL